MARRAKRAKKTSKRKVLIIAIAAVLVALVGVGAFFLIKGKEPPAPIQPTVSPEEEEAGPKFVRQESAAADHIGVIHVEQEAVVDGASKVLITLTDVDSNTLDTLETVIRDGEDIGDVKVCMPESEHNMIGFVLLTGSEMPTTVVSAFRGKLYTSTAIDWVEEEGAYDEADQRVGAWIDVALPNGETMKLPRGESAAWFPGNAVTAGQIADQMLGEGNWSLREVTLPGDWVEALLPSMEESKFKSYHAFEIVTKSGDVKATVVLDSMRIIIDVRLAGSTEWQGVSIGVDEKGPIFYAGWDKL